MRIKKAQPRDKAAHQSEASPLRSLASSPPADTLHLKQRQEGGDSGGRSNRVKFPFRDLVGQPKEAVVTLRWQDKRVEIKLKPGHGLLIQVEERPGVGSWSFTGMPAPHRVIEGASFLPSLLHLPGGLAYNKRFRWTAAQIAQLPDSFEFEARCREPVPIMRVTLSVQRAPIS